jgi:thymidylate kinase
MSERASEPFRVGVVGIDGAGKSSTTLRAIDLLCKDYRIGKPGRDAFVQNGMERQFCAKAVSDRFERTFRRADRTGNRAVIGASRLAFIAYQGWLEPYLWRKFEPSLLLSTRCMIVDPAVYSQIYWPTSGRLSLASRFRWFRGLSRLPYRDLYVLLRTPAAVAMKRIFGRIAKTPGYEHQPREYWLHLHEREPILERIGNLFEEALALGQRLHGFDVVPIETVNYTEEQVAARIASEVRNRLQPVGLSEAGVCG